MLFLDNSDSEDNMRMQKKRKVRSTKKKRDSNAGQLPLTLNLLKW